jgi:hypothetical protein
VVTSDRCKFPLQAVTKKLVKFGQERGLKTQTKTAVFSVDWTLKFKMDEKNAWNLAWQ